MVDGRSRRAVVNFTVGALQGWLSRLHPRWKVGRRMTDWPVNLEVNNGTFIEHYDYEPGMQVADLVRKFQEDHGFRFAADPKVYDSGRGNTGHPLSYATEIINDGRVYSMTVW